MATFVRKRSVAVAILFVSALIRAYDGNLAVARPSFSKLLTLGIHATKKNSNTKKATLTTSKAC